LTKYPTNLEYLLKLNQCRQDKDLQKVEYELCRRNPTYWLNNFVLTLNSKDTVNPIQRWPDLEYLREITKIWLRERLLLIPKSRQMMLTWLMVALYLHNAQFTDGRLIFFQSKKEEDAFALIERAWFIYEHQPEWLKRPATHTKAEIYFPKHYSKIRGVPQGADQIRSYTSSGILIDEAAFQPEVENAYTALKPSIDGGGGSVTMVSSADPGFFERMVHDVK